MLLKALERTFIISAFLMLPLLARADTVFSNAANYLTSLGAWEENNGMSGPTAACHSSVIDMLTQYGISSWGGYRYFMTWTTDGVIFYENTYLSGSNDAPSTSQDWLPHATSAPKVAGRPANGYLVEVSQDGGMDGNGDADDELLYDPNLDKLVVFYIKDGTGMYRTTINSSLTLSGEPVLCLADSNMLSPTVVADGTPGIYHLWYVSANDLQIYHRVSTDYGVTWGSTQECTHNIIQDNYPGYTPWHIEARKNPIDTSKVEFVVASQNPPNGYAGMVLLHAEVDLSNPTALSAPLAPEKLLQPSSVGWDSAGLYRSSFVLKRLGNDLLMDLYYDGFSNEWDHIGFTSGVLFHYPDQDATPPAAPTSLGVM